MVIAFRGTEFKSDIDWAADVSNVIDIINVQGQYKDALIYTKNVLSQYKNARIVGHSLGGGLAMYTAGMTGAPATTFNAAKLGLPARIDINNNATTNNGVAAVRNFVYSNEPVQFILSDAGYLGTPTHFGEQKEGVDFSAHSIDATIGYMTYVRGAIELTKKEIANVKAGTISTAVFY